MSQAADRAAKPAIPEIDAAQSRRALLTAGTLAAVGCGCAALEHLVTGLGGPAGLDGERLGLALAGVLSALLLALAVAWIARHRARPLDMPLLTVTALAIAAGNAVAAMIVLADPGQSLLVLVVIVAAGSLVTSRLWLAATLAAALGSWAAGAAAVGADAGWFPYGAGLLAAAGAATLLHGLSAGSHAGIRAERSAAAAHLVRDELTGALNAQGLALFGTQILESARRQGDAVHALFVAVDGLPRVIEVFGTEAGEDMLVAVAEALRSATRGTDVVARWDTDVFVVLGPGSGAAVAHIERRMAAGLAILTFPVGPAPRVLAAGALLAPWDAGTIESLLHKADTQFAARRSLRRRASDAPPAGSPPTGSTSLR